MDQGEQADPYVITSKMIPSCPDQTIYKPMRGCALFLYHHDGIDPGWAEPLSFDDEVVLRQLRGGPLAVGSADDV